MQRYTEYHAGVAVIKDKSKLSEAMEKLAVYEDYEQAFYKTVLGKCAIDGRVVVQNTTMNLCKMPEDNEVEV